ncbi:MAG: shikimate kinase [Planctomycetota bacterium]
MNIALIGFRCSGKTAAGKILAQRMGCDFIDIDEIIASDEGKSIAGIFKEDGESAFRRLEATALRKVLSGGNQVISCGGGIVLREENVALLRERSIVVWLAATAETCVKRMREDEQKGIKRPSLTGAPPVEEIESLLASRIPLYEEVCNYRIDTDAISPRRVAERIRREIGNTRLQEINND